MARLLDGATSSEMKRGKNRTYALIDTTVFDVWRDLKEYEEGGLKRPAKDQDGRESKRILAMRIIARELRQRMRANRTLAEGLGDLEVARRKLRLKGGAGTISCLVNAIRLKNGFKIDSRTKQFVFEY